MHSIKVICTIVQSHVGTKFIYQRQTCISAHRLILCTLESFGFLIRSRRPGLSKAVEYPQLGRLQLRICGCAGTRGVQQSGRGVADGELRAAKRAGSGAVQRQAPPQDPVARVQRNDGSAERLHRTCALLRFLSVYAPKSLK